jgi:hypothetical protein
LYFALSAPQLRTMKGKNLHKAAVLSTGGEKGSPLKADVLAKGRDNRHARLQSNYKEDAMLDALDLKRQLEKLVPIFEKLDRGHFDIGQALTAISGPALKQLVELGFSGDSDKVKLDAVKHLLGLGGHVPVQKHLVGAVDATQSKEALKAMIAGASTDLAAEGIEIVDDREDQAE